jgi:EAL domain-containing protein (putative c-di-GMP-specific phosphodiesterase class I)
MGLIGEIGTWVLHEACRVAATWPDHLTVAVNLSPLQFAGGGISGVVEAALARHSLPARRLELEITESLLLQDDAAVMEELKKLKEIGVSIAMDDFGTGYSSLSYLWRFPFDKIKIDCAFMWAFDNGDPNAKSILTSIAALGRSLNMLVTVEGVENERQAQFVRELGCNFVQGFLFGRPVPTAEVAAIVTKDWKASIANQPAPKAAVLRLVHAG